MVAIPTIEDEARIVNRMKAELSRLGIRGFNPKPKRAAMLGLADAYLPRSCS
jgi:hypothetical protein